MIVCIVAPTFAVIRLPPRDEHLITIQYLVRACSPYESESHFANIVNFDSNDALAWMNRKGESVTQWQLAILRAATCSIEEKAIARPPEQHELVRQGVEHIVEEQAHRAGVGSLVALLVP